MASILRVLGSIVAAVVVALALLIVVEIFSAVVHPVPADFDNSMEQMCAHVANYPHWVLAAVVPMWAGIALLSTWIAGRFGNLGAALLIGALLVAALVFNVSMLPYHLWFKVVILLAVPAAVALAVFLSRPRATPTASIA